LAATQIARITSTATLTPCAWIPGEIAGTPMTTAAYAPRRADHGVIWLGGVISSICEQHRARFQEVPLPARLQSVSGAISVKTIRSVVDGLHLS
jgi:hypothetical protein